MNTSERIQSKNPIIQKCLDIVYGGNVTISRSGLTGYLVKCNDKRIFAIDSFGTFYEVQINDIEFRYQVGQDKTDAGALYGLCVAEHVRQTQLRTAAALNYLNSFTK